MTVISMERERCPRSARKTCLPLPGALATGAPALWPAFVQLDTARIHLLHWAGDRHSGKQPRGRRSSRACRWSPTGSALLREARLPHPFGKKKGKSQGGSGRTGARRRWLTPEILRLFDIV